MLVVVTGGSGSGKSAFAEETVLSLGEARRIYIATMQDCVVLLECMSNLVANEMFREGGFHPEVAEKITEGVKNLLSQAKHVVIVTNEIFSDGILYEEESEQYKKELGQINQKLAELAEEVVEVVYGIPVWHKGGKEA